MNSRILFAVAVAALLTAGEARELLQDVPCVVEKKPSGTVRARALRRRGRRMHRAAGGAGASPLLRRRRGLSCREPYPAGPLALAPAPLRPRRPPPHTPLARAQPSMLRISALNVAGGVAKFSAWVWAVPLVKANQGCVSDIQWAVTKKGDPAPDPAVDYTGDFAGSNDVYYDAFMPNAPTFLPKDGSLPIGEDKYTVHRRPRARGAGACASARAAPHAAPRLPAHLHAQPAPHTNHKQHNTPLRTPSLRRSCTSVG